MLSSNNQANDYNTNLYQDVLVANVSQMASEISASSGLDFAKRSAFNTVFGESVVASRQNNINIPFIRSNGNNGLEYNLKSTDYFQSGTATQSNTNQTAYVESGSGVGLSEIKSKNTNRYITGHISDCFFTTVYNDIDVGVDSGVGYGSIRGGDFIGFGYKGLDYGIWLKLRGVETFIKQVDWNTRTLLDGDFILNTTKENIMSISFGYAVADILFSIKSNSGWTLVHRHRTANIDNKPHLSNPTQPMSEFIRRNSGTGANIKVGTSSWNAGTVGERASGTGADKFPYIKRTDIALVANVEKVLLSIRNRIEYPVGTPNTVRLRYGTLSITSDGTKPVEFNVYLNGVNSAVGTWGFYDEQLSVSEINIDSPLALTNRTIVTGVTKPNQQIGGTFLNKVDRERINLFSSDVIISANAGDIITITAKSTGSSVIDFQIRWIEEF